MPRQGLFDGNQVAQRLAHLFFAYLAPGRYAIQYLTKAFSPV